MRFAFLDRTGHSIAMLGDPGIYRRPAIAPGERAAAVVRLDVKTYTYDIWIVDLINGEMTRLSFDAANDDFPIWAPDGRTLAFASNRSGILDLYTITFSGGHESLLHATRSMKFLTDWSRDGKYLLFNETSSGVGSDLWSLSMDSEHKLTRVIEAQGFLHLQAQFSPDGKWIAYVSNESGSLEVYVGTFPRLSEKRKVSSHGGSQPRWRGDGHELFYVSSDRYLMAVPTKLSATGIENGVPKRLFSMRVPPTDDVLASASYAVTRDGKQFLMAMLVEETKSVPIHITLNWTGGLKR
jgi:eukaryotic-like serine/threonine-protein kinase